MMSVTKLLILAICAFVVWKLFVGDKRWKETKAQEKKEDLVASGEMVKDPVCGAYVSKNSDIRVRQGDVLLNFCSYDCREKYLARIEGENGGGQA
ncbi:transcriptional regulator [Humidesulfovibrio sp.]|jgi:YHS domain-containing protein|uniref:transcriptional regulator n=1 Tax=Humidesulfovibrio sp. TaxID=2910988 RepID=UPI003524CF18